MTTTVRVHVKVVVNPNVSIETMLHNMREIYATCGIDVEVGSRESFPRLRDLDDVDVGRCVRGETTEEQDRLFSHRRNVGANDVVAYFVRSTVPPFSGCAAHPDGLPGVVVAQGATQFTLAHEIGHVLGLNHVDNGDRLMTDNGTSGITNLPPDLSTRECTRMKDSPLTINV